MNRNTLIDIPPAGGRARVNAVEAAALQAIADYEAVTVSEAVRMLIREGALKRELWPLEKMRAAAGSQVSEATDSAAVQNTNGQNHQQLESTSR